MKMIQNILSKVRPNFEKGGKLEKFYPAYDALETFMFVPGHPTHKGSHIRDGIDLKRTMIIVVLSMIPCLLFGMWNIGDFHYDAIQGSAATLMDKFLFGLVRVLPIIVVSYVAGLSIEFIFAISRRHAVNEGFLVTGMLIPLIVPVDIPLWMVAVATIFSVVIGKEVFGGTGMNILNPALTARAFLFFAYPKDMSGNEVWADTTLAEGEVAAIDAFSGATPLGDAAGTVDLAKKIREAKTDGETEVVETLNGQVSDIVNSLPSWEDGFFGNILGSIGETSAVAYLIFSLIAAMATIAMNQPNPEPNPKAVASTMLVY